MKKKYVVLGAGPAGLTIANQLKARGEDVLVIEKEKEAGGLCRSTMVDGTELDIGGGHFLDVRRPKVTEFLFRFMPENQWNFFTRDSRIHIHHMEVGHPLEANIWQMPEEMQQQYLSSIAKAGCNTGEEQPDTFVDWIRWKLGNQIAEDYMLPYNEKMFQKDLDQLGTYWLEKLPNVSYEETLQSCKEHKPYGTQPGHARFYYPKAYGYGELWRRMGEKLGDSLICNATVVELDYDGKKVVVEREKTETGENSCGCGGNCGCGPRKDREFLEITADVIITTIPWTSIPILTGLPEELLTGIGRLKHSSVEIRYYEENLDTPAQWIYYPDPERFYHRILVRSNFCAGSRGYWTETNKERIHLIPEADQKRFHYMNEYAYPLNTIDKPQIMKALLEYSKSKGIYGLGRWGEWEHYNSDLTVERALTLAEEI